MAVLLQTARQRARVVEHRLRMHAERRLQRLAERDRLRRHDVQVRRALQPREHRLVDALGQPLFIAEDQRATRSAQRLVGRGRDDVRMRERMRMRAAGDEPGEMRHVDQQAGAGGIGGAAEGREIERPGIGRAAGDQDLRPVLTGQPQHLVRIDQPVVGPHAVVHDPEPAPAGVDGGAMAQVPAGVQVHRQDRVAGRGQRVQHRMVGLAARVRLHVGMPAAEQRAGPFDRQPFDLVDMGRAGVETVTRVALDGLVGQDRTLHVEHGAADQVLGGDQLDHIALALQFGADRAGDRRVALADGTAEVVLGQGVVGGGLHGVVMERRHAANPRMAQGGSAPASRPSGSHAYTPAPANGLRPGSTRR